MGILSLGLVVVGTAIAWLLLNDRESPETPPAAGSTPTSSATPPTGQVVCWDKSVVKELGQCSAPRGVAGLRWAFPSFDRDFESCLVRPDPVAPGKRRAWFCPFTDNEVEGIRYNIWESARTARRVTDTDYGPQYPATSVDLGGGRGLRVWRRNSPDELGHFTSALAYRHWPLSADVQSTNAAGLDAACPLVTLRSPSTFELVSDICAKAR